MSIHFSRPQPHQPRQERQEEDRERAQQPIRIVILLEERQPIGLELDFGAEVGAQPPALTGTIYQAYLVGILIISININSTTAVFVVLGTVNCLV